VNDSAKPVLYLLPGLLCDKTVWVHQVEFLSDLVDIRIPDFRGYDSLTKMAESVLSAVPPKFMVAGHSMGGRVALEIMRLGGERVEKLALLDTGVHRQADGEPEKRQRSLDLARKEGISVLARTWAPPMVHPARHDDSEFMASIYDMVKRYSFSEYQGQITALLNRRDATQQLDSITCDTLVLCGEDDAWSPVAQHWVIASEIAGAELVVIPGCGHMSTMERPREVTDAMRNWITA
jgi:pimeloyl-ACP methyl ester carboxylesterase